MENMKKYELTDEVLEDVSGGVSRVLPQAYVMSGSMLRGSFPTTANENDEVFSSGFEGMDIPVGAISEA